MIVVDEAAMVGTRRLARLLDHAGAAGAKVVLVGDRHQLPAIEAGGAFAGLAQRLGVITLTENRRQDEAWERQALADLRAGHVAAALEAYRSHGRTHEGDTADTVKERLVADWWAARQAGGRQLMIATRHRDVDDLNRRARTYLRTAGHLGDQELVVGGRRFAVGDEVLATRNDYRLGVLNGTRAIVVALDCSSGELTIQRDDAGRVVLPGAYLQPGHLTHGYATTLHKAQGATLRQAFLLADETVTRQRGYTGLSRGTERNDVYAVAADDERDDIHHGRDHTPDPLDQMTERLARSEAETLGIDERISGRLVRPAGAPLSLLLGEQRRLRDRLGPQPRFALDAQRIAHADRQRAERHLATARAEREAAEAAMCETTRLRRLLRPKESSALSDALHHALSVEAEAEHMHDRAQHRCEHIDTEVSEWQDWRAEHASDLVALRDINAAIHARTRSRETTILRVKQPTPQVEPDLGIDLGP